MALAWNYTVMYLGIEPFFLLSVAADGKKGHRLKLEKTGPNKTQMYYGHYSLTKFVDIFFLMLQDHFVYVEENDLSKELT